MSISRMASVQKQTSSGSEGNDERKKRRMISNRESARRSRMRKQKQLDDLLNQVDELTKENDVVVEQVNSTTERYVLVESENNVLRAQMMELNDRLHSLNSVLHIAEEVSGFSMDIPEIPDPLLKPWKIPCPLQPIMASADIQF